MRIIKILTAIPLLFSLLHAKNDWKEFGIDKSTDKTLFNIQKDIEYFELRTYLFDDKGNKLSPKFIRYHVAGRKKLEDYPFDMQKHFFKIQFIHSPEPSINNHIEKWWCKSGSILYKTNGYLIKKDQTMAVLNEKEDVLWVYDEIDRLEELYMFSKMYNVIKDNDTYVKYKYKYRKVANGYEIKEQTIEDHTIAQSQEECYTLYETRIYTISKKGQIDTTLISSRKKPEKWILSDERIDYPSCMGESLEQRVERIVNQKWSGFVSPVVK